MCRSIVLNVSNGRHTPSRPLYLARETGDLASRRRRFYRPLLFATRTTDNGGPLFTGLHRRTKLSPPLFLSADGFAGRLRLRHDPLGY